MWELPAGVDGWLAGWLAAVGPCTVAVHAPQAVMSDGNGGSGGGGGARDGGDAHDAGPQEPQSLGSLAPRTPAPSPSRPTAAAAGGGAEGSWKETWPPGFSTSAVCCGCTAEGAGGGWASGPDVASGIHPDLRDLQHCAASEAGGGHGTLLICLRLLHRRRPCRFPSATLGTARP